VARVALKRVDDRLGAPWDRPLQGTLDELVVDSELLADNPLGDSPRRPLLVYQAPGAGDAGGVPSVYVIQGYGGQAREWLNRDSFDPSPIDRLDAMFAAEECPPAVIVFVDAWTSLGGSQFLNSAGTGRYLDYLCDEVVPFVDANYPTRSAREHRGIAGKSSGGYGAMVVPMLRPDTFGALASHAGDALFEACYLPSFPRIARGLRDHFDGSLDQLLEEVNNTDHFDWSKFGEAYSMFAYAAAYSPDPHDPTKVLLPFDVETGRTRDDVWTRWLEHDPVRMVAGHADALRSMRRIYLDAGRSDEWFLDLGAQAFARELDKIGAEHTLELFDGTHGGIAYRYPGAIRELVLALR
jgi:Putative esterase